MAIARDARGARAPRDERNRTAWAGTGSWGRIDCRRNGHGSPERPCGSCRTRSLDYRAPADRARRRPSRPNMLLSRLVAKNAFRHKLRTALTVVGIVVAITAFGLLRTIVDAWYAGANASSSARLVTRSAVSLVFSLPLTYAQKIRQVPGVRSVSWANWFGGVYISERNFFPQFAIDATSYLDMYPEFILPAGERKAFMTDRKGAVVGPQARRAVWLVDRRRDSDARHDLLGQLEFHAARHLRRGQGGRPVDDVLPLGLSQRVDQEALSAPRRSDRRVHRAARDPGAGGGGLGGHRRDVQELARRDAARKRKRPFSCRSSP